METKNQIESLETALHHYLTLHERLSEERQILSKQNAELGKWVTRLSAQIEKIQESGHLLAKYIGKCMNESASEMAQQASAEFKKEVLKDVKASTEELQKVSKETICHFRELKQSHSISTRYFITGLIFLPILTSLLIFWWLIPNPVVPLTDKQMITYQEGKIFERFWPKLNKKQQKFLTQLGTGEIDNQAQHLENMED